MNLPGREVVEHVKPRLRGWLHAIGVLLLLACSPILWVRAHSGAQIGWALCFVFGVAVMMTTSALFHRITWSPRLRRMWRRADHSAIFAAIAGSYFGIAGLTLHGTARVVLLSIVGGGAIIGIIIRQVALDAPKWVTTIPYVVVGWSAVFFLPEIYRGGGLAVVILIMLGGLAYTVGAIFYGAKRPRLWPRTFGYHELFHACTLVGASLHFAAVAVAMR